jgi:hypothetical protein
MMGGIVLAAIQILPHGLVVSERVGVIVGVGVIIVHLGVVVGVGVIIGVGVVVGVGVVIVRVGVVVGVGVVVVRVGVIVGVGVIVVRVGVIVVRVGVVVLVLKCFFYLLLELPWFFCPHKNRRVHKRIWWVSTMELFKLSSVSVSFSVSG